MDDENGRREDSREAGRLPTPEGQVHRILGLDWTLSPECLRQIEAIEDNMREARRRGHEFVVG